MNQMVQQLEGRQLLSASVAGGVLTITGTSSNDDIVVSLSSDGATLTVSEAKARRFGKRATATTTTFDASTVTSIVVNAGAGNDSVAVRGATKRSALAIAATINGEDGNDRLSGGSLADVINGGAGDDDLNGGDGDDTLNGDAGDDKLVGGKGADNMNGGDDDDLIDARDGDTTDVIDGGADTAATGEDDADKAIVDDTETATNATVVTASDLRGPGGGRHHGRGHGGSFGGAGGFSTRRIR